MNKDQIPTPQPSRADMWREILTDQDRLKRCCSEFRRKVLLVTKFFDNHLGADWRSHGNIEDGIEFEVALLQLEKKLNDTKR